MGAYHELLAFILALFFALSVRSFILLFIQSSRGASAILFRFLAGTALLVLGWLYFLFASPLLIWDRPARAVAIITFVAVPLWTVIRHARGWGKKPDGVLAKLVKAALFAVLIITATSTIIRTGYIAVTGDRVTLLVDVTGETRNQTVPGRTAGEGTLVAHRIIFWLPTGEKAADMWLYGDEMAVHGKTIRFSHALNAMDIPNLYALQYAHNGYLSTERQNAYPQEAIPFPGTGELAVHRWWRPVQERLLNLWANLSSSGSWWAIQMGDNESPYYPLIDPDGKPVHKYFLLVLQPEAVAISRGSSPLENRRNDSK